MAHIHLQHDAAYYAEKAEALFEEGYNCSQAVLLAFAEECGLSTAVLQDFYLSAALTIRLQLRLRVDRALQEF